LLQHGAGVDIADTLGKECLNTADQFGQLEVLRELLIHGASVDMANNWSDTTQRSSCKLSRGGCLRVAESWG